MGHVCRVSHVTVLLATVARAIIARLHDCSLLSLLASIIVTCNDSKSQVFTKSKLFTLQVIYSVVKQVKQVKNAPLLASARTSASRKNGGEITVGLSKAQISSLLAKPGKTSGEAFFDNGEWDQGNLTSREVGKYIGKQGSVTRSRKGHTRIIPNGYRKYDDTTNLPETVVQAYYAAKVVK